MRNSAFLQILYGKKEDFIQPYLDVYRIQEVAHRYTGFSLPEERTSQN